MGRWWQARVTAGPFGDPAGAVDVQTNGKGEFSPRYEDARLPETAPQPTTSEPTTEPPGSRSQRRGKGTRKTQQPGKGQPKERAAQRTTAKRTQPTQSEAGDAKKRLSKMGIEPMIFTV